MTTDDESGPKTVTREELYAQVWKTPMSRLSTEYGISGKGLAKICDRLKVPYPPRGYWARKEAGQRVLTYRLPKADEEVPASVTITPTPPPVELPGLPTDVQVKADAARKDGERVSVADRLAKPHRVIAAWIEAAAQSRAEAQREREPWRRKWLLERAVFTDMERRKHRILDALFKALERNGAKVTETERRELIAEPSGERVEFGVREKQIRRPLTVDEKKWASPGSRDWKKDLEATGRLVFAIKGYPPAGVRTEWLETEEQPLEDMLPDIVAAFVALGPLLVARRLQREEEERQRRLAEQRRYEEQQRRKRDDKRWKTLISLAQMKRDAELAAELIAALKSKDMDSDAVVDGRPLREWIDWAEERAAKANPANLGAQAVFEQIASVNEWNYRDELQG